MAKDTREVNNGIRTLVDDKNRQARVLVTDDADEIAGMYSQSDLDKMVENGVLSGEWKSTKKAESNYDTAQKPVEKR